MDFTEQTEQIFDFFESKLSKENLSLMLDIKSRYNNDYNILASFFKDYLTLKNNYIECKDENIVCDFKIYYKKIIETFGENVLIQELYNCAKYYLILIFEKKFEYNLIDNEIIGYIETINLFFAMELYPYLLNKLDKFLNLKIDRNNFSIMLKSLVDIVVERNMDEINEKIDLLFLDYEISKRILKKDYISGKIAG